MRGLGSSISDAAPARVNRWGYKYIFRQHCMKWLRMGARYTWGHSSFTPKKWI